MVDKKPIILLIIVVAIVIFPLALYNGKGESQGIFSGSDDQGPAYISSTGYTPWFHSIWTPSPEIESLLFAVQAGIGALIVGYVLGYYNGQSKERKRRENDIPNKNKKYKPKNIK